LTDEEARAMREMEREKFDVVADELEERVSRAGFGFSHFLKRADLTEALRRAGAAYCK
jgi:hypothetical protein